MKTYEEMARSVIRRAKTHRTIRNRCIFVATAAVCVFAIGMGLMVQKKSAGYEALTLQTPTVTTSPIMQSQTQIELLLCEGSNIAAMQKGIAVPSYSIIRVRDIHGLTEAQVAAVCKEEQDYAQDLVDSYPHKKGFTWTQYKGKENKVMTFISAGHFILEIDDPEQVESICMTVDGSILLTNIPAASDPIVLYAPKEYRMTHEQVQQYYYEPYGGVAIGWMPLGGEWMEQFDQGLVSLSDLSDTVSVTVTFRNGITESCAVDLLISDNGEVYYIYQGATSAV